VGSVTDREGGGAQISAGTGWEIRAVLPMTVLCAAPPIHSMEGGCLSVCGGGMHRARQHPPMST
jgi:hypothetical protein